MGRSASSGDLDELRAQVLSALQTSVQRDLGRARRWSPYLSDYAATLLLSRNWAPQGSGFLPSRIPSAKAVWYRTKRSELFFGAAAVVQTRALAVEKCPESISRLVEDRDWLMKHWLKHPASTVFGIAHGELGVALALLNAYLCLGHTPPRPLLRRVLVARDAARARGRWHPSQQLEGSLCGGMAGAAIVLWLAGHAFEDSSILDAGRQLALHACSYRDLPDLCCGSVGAALAAHLWTLKQPDPEVACARDAALNSAARQTHAFPAIIGLWKGLTGFSLVAHFSCQERLDSLPSLVPATVLRHLGF